MEQGQHGYYVQIGMHTIRSDNGNQSIPLYMQVTDDKAYKAQMEKCLSGISKIFIEKYQERLQTVTGGANG